MRNARSLPLVLALSGCDPVVSLDVEVVVPAEAQATLAGPRPALVLLALDGVDTGGAADPRLFGVICGAGSEARTFTESMSYVGCSDEALVRAWLVASPEGSDIDCTTDPPTVLALELAPVVEPPWGTAVVFEGRHDDCESVDEQVTVTLAAP
jgi:hypothetical protein